MREQNAIYAYMPKQALNRHWLWMFLWCGAGILLAAQVGAWAWCGAVAAGCAGLAALYAPARLARRSYIGLALTCLALGLALFALRQPRDNRDALFQFARSYPRQTLVFEGMASDTQVFLDATGHQRFVLHVDRILMNDRAIPMRGRALVRWNNADRAVYADTRLRVSGRLSPQLGVVNHGLHGMEDTYRGRSVFSRIQVSGNGVDALSVRRWSPRYWAGRLRQWQALRFAEVVPDSAYPFVLGVWLGERSLIKPELYQSFIRAGTAHVLAVSGVHAAIITFTVGFLLQLFRTPHRARILLMMAAVILFASMTGARTATLRAAFMIILYLTAEFFDREPDALSTLGLAGFSFLVWNPNQLFDAGFLLSFASVASILLFYPGMARHMEKVPGILRASLAMTASVQILSAPISVWFFNLLPLAGIAANLVVVPLLTLSLWLCLAISVTVGWAPPVALLLGHALLPVVTLIQGINEYVAAVPGTYGYLLRPSLFALLGYGMGVAYLHQLFYEDRGRRRNACIVAALFGVSLLLWNLRYDAPGVDFIDVGRGDAVLLRPPGGATILVDGGDRSDYADAGQFVVAPFLYAHGIRRLDYVVVSHNHRDHIGGLFHIIERFPVNTVVMGPASNDGNALEQAFLALCVDHGVTLLRLESGASLPVKGAHIQALHPPADWGQNYSQNDRSLVLRVSWPGFSLLLPGDVEAAAEQLLTRQGLVPTLVLKAPHHGSPTSSSDAFLDQVAPQLAVASLQTQGSRPSLMTDGMMARYDARDIALFRTDWHGGVRLRVRKGRLEVQSARAARGYSLSPIE